MKISLHQRVVLTLLGTFFFTFGAQAQVDPAVEKELRTFIESFARDYTNLPTSKNKQNVLKYFSPEARSNLYVFNISGRSRVQNSDTKGFEAYLDNILRSSGLTLKYEVGEMHVTHAKNGIATLMYTVEYETKQEDGIWVKGAETVTMALEKKNKAWQIVHYTILQIEDEKLKGTCLCELFAAADDAEDGEVVAKTTIPSGRSYATKFDNFEFRSAGKDQIIKTGGNMYKRLSSGELVVVEDDEETQIGIATGKRDVVLTIILEHLYKDSCARLKSKAK
ncbi:MAG: nuclear transport factor 2 family protein [Bacteroidota bacterium]